MAGVITAAEPSWIPPFTGLGVPGRCRCDDRVLLVTAYRRTNLTLRQLAPLPGVSKSAAARITDRIGPFLALKQRQRFRTGTVLIVDGTLVPTRDHGIAEQSKNYRYSTSPPPDGAAGQQESANGGDVGGWAGGLMTFWADWRNSGQEYAGPLQFAHAKLAVPGVNSSFGFNDLIEDADGSRISLAAVTSSATSSRASPTRYRPAWERRPPSCPCTGQTMRSTSRQPAHAPPGDD